MTRRNLWRLAATILLAVCLSPLAAWIYSRVETAREITYFRQFEFKEGKGDKTFQQISLFLNPKTRLQTNWLLPRERLESWMPDGLEPRLLPLFEVPNGLWIPDPILQESAAAFPSGDKAAPELRRVFRLTSLEMLSIGDNSTFEFDGTLARIDGMLAPPEPKAGGNLSELKNLRKLKTLTIAGIQIDHAAARSIGTLNALEALMLRQNSMTDSDLVPMGKLKRLTNLEVVANPITDQGVAALAGLVNLKRLNLSSTRVTRGCIPYLKRMTRLEELYTPEIELIDDDLAILSTMRLTRLGITSPHVTDAGLAHLAGMPQLESLDIAATKVTGEGLKPLRSLTRLKSIALPQTPGIGQGLKYLRGCPLIRLDFPSRAITDADLPDFVWFIPKLDHKHLYLFDSEVTDAGMPALAQLTYCELVSLENTRITDAGLEPLTHIPGLRRIGLSGTKVTSAGLRILSQISTLDELKLGGTQVDDAGLAELSKLPELRHLDLRSTLVTDAGIEHLLQCKSLVSLNLADTGVTDSGFLKLAAMPYLDRAEVDNTAVTKEAWNEFFARKAASKQAKGPHK